MKHATIVCLFVAITSMLPLAAYAQGAGAEWEVLNQEVVDLYHAGKLDRALVVAQKALEVAEQNAGKDHPDVVQSLNNLAGLYAIQGDYAKAEPLLKRSLAIREKALGPDHPDVATSLENLAFFYAEQGDYDKAVPLLQRAGQIRAIKR